MSMWLLEPSILAQIHAAQVAGVKPTAEEMAAFVAEYADDGDYPGARILNKVGGVASISISGTLTKNPSWMARWFGGGNTAYSEIHSAVNEAERDPNIKTVTFTIDSGGGQTNGLTNVMDAIQGMTKPTKAIVSGMAASAAYGIASQADEIVATSRGDLLGSIGIAASFYADPNVVDVTSTNAPEKRPNMSTEEGISAVRKGLDQIETIFIDGIAAGRGVSAKTVKSDFGRGNIFTADNALKNGMIDGIEGEARTKTAIKQPTKEAKTMDLATLQAQHPSLYAQVVQIGATTERDRVTAHLIMGETSGDMATAAAACKDGSTMTATLQAQYFSATVKNGALAARAADDTAASTAVDTANKPTATAAQDFEAALDLELGIKGE